MQGARSTMAQEETVHRLTIPPAVTISGEIRQAEDLTVEGRVEADIHGTRTLEITESGSFVGNAEVELADIQGWIDGNLTVTKQLIIRSSGRVTGRVRYRDLYIEAGGRLAGQVDALEPGVETETPSVSSGDVDR